ncbi:mechanosensitive ion channel family protein [Natrinema gelatinilyticum]|uniref:mechanosensitive ion channel family protein n=1 Tax=Natrinema gelatinilyticum TaxID=2961571 RepID=UPI0020C3A3F0|nr:mechanosensitive ion channel family protein [Natrinema gelatinilyticum]
MVNVDPLPEFIISLSDQPWVLVGGILLGSVLLSRVLEWGGTQLLNRSARWSETSISHVFIDGIRIPLHVSIIVGGILLSLNVLEDVSSTPYVLENVSSIPYFINFLTSLVVILWMRAFVRLGAEWIEVVNAADSEYEFSPIFKNSWTILLILVTGSFLLVIWEIDITPILASAGVLSIILGLAAQDAIGNLIGGVSLYFDDTYNTGDVIVLEDGQRGTVTDIGIRSTTILTRDNIVITVPNSVLNSSSVINESAPQRRKRIRVPITVAYGTDHKEVEEILLELCDETALILDKPTPQVMFQEFGDSALVFELWAYVDHPFSEPRATDQINRRVYERFDNADITIPFPQREISYLTRKDKRMSETPLSQEENKRVTEYVEEEDHG